MPLLSSEQTGTLCALLRDHFTAEDLEQLVAIRLSAQLTDATSLQNPFPKVVFDLVSWLERVERTRDFLRAVRDDRAGVAAVVIFCDPILAAAPTPPQGTREAAAAAVWSVRELANLLREQPAQDAIARYEGSFGEAAATIRELGRLKKLHDNFHVAEGAVKMVMLGLRPLRAPADGGPERIGFDDDLANAADALGVELKKITDYADAAGFPPAAIAWRKQVTRAGDDLTAGVAAADGGRISQVIVRLQNLIGSELPKLNLKIVQLARLLSLRDVADGLREVHAGAVAGHSFDEDSVRRLERFDRGVAAVLELDDGLRVLLDNHDWLQGIEVTLGQLGAGRTPDVTVVTDIWEDVRGLVDRLHPSAAPDWTAPLAGLAGKVTAALDPPPTEPGPVRVAQQGVTQFRLEMQKAFNRTDADLLTLCGRLEQFGVALGGTLRELLNV